MNVVGESVNAVDLIINRITMGEHVGEGTFCDVDTCNKVRAVHTGLDSVANECLQHVQVGLR